LEKTWKELSPDEKREKRFKQWLAPSDIKFSNRNTELNYKKRLQRIIDVILLKVPDRVPVMLPTANYPIYHANSTLQEAMYNYNEIRRAWSKFLHDFDMDIRNHGLVLPGRMLANLDYRLYQWPGHGLNSNATSYQCVEGEYMMADEYEALIKDPSDFWMRVYLPRIFGAFEPFRMLAPFTSIMEIPIGYFIPYTRPEVQALLQKLLEAGKETAKWLEVTTAYEKEALEAGFPSFGNIVAKAPFDVIGDTMRGTQGIMIDMYRKPDQLLEAMEKILPLHLEAAIFEVNTTGSQVVFMPLHKGSDGFMSMKQFEKFYWPTLKKFVLGLIDEGIVPLLFAEGNYNTRFEIVNDLPRGAVIWWLDQSNMDQAKKILGEKSCICGNVPTSLLCTGTPQAVKEYCRKLIEDVGKGGGFILTGGATIDKGNPENLRAMMAAAEEYGVYA
jgi:uroporphyrinogen-III decarboxylase